MTSFEVNHDNVFNLAKGLSDNHILISESGIESRKDIMNLYMSGINNFLIGESIMRAKNKMKFIQELRSLKT